MVFFTLDIVLHKKNISRYALSKMTDIDNNTLSKIYYNKSTQVRLETLDKICTALDCQLSELIDFKKDTSN